MKAVTTFVIFWAILGLATLGLAVYRKLASMREDAFLHLAPGAEHVIPQQVAMSRKLGAIDRWGIALTIATLVLGLALAGIYVYQAAQVVRY